MAQTDISDNIRQVRPSQLIPLLEICRAAKRPAFIWGQPGIGKSDLVRQLGEKHNCRVVDVRLLLLEPTDLRGIPYRDRHVTTDDIVSTMTEVTKSMSKSLKNLKLDDDHAKLVLSKALEGALENAGTSGMSWSQPNELPNPNDQDNIILFLDELTAAPQSVQAAAYQLVLDRKIGSYILPPNCVIIAAGNRMSDRGVSFKMPTPLANRFVHFELCSDFEDWHYWAIKNRVNPEVLGFLGAFKGKLNQFTPTDAERAFPTPRSWAFVSDMLWNINTIDDGMLQHLVAGCIGNGVASEFMAHRKYSKDLPKPSDILIGKAKEMNNKEISAQYAISAALTYELHDRYLKAKENKKLDAWHDEANYFFEFIMKNFSKELVIMSVRTAIKGYDIQIASRKIKSWSKFFEKYGKLISQAI